MQKTYITSPIYYVNDVPHIGHAYTTILCDMLKKYRTLLGEEVFLLTGTDEHGQKIELSAKKHNQSPQDFADSVSAKFRAIWEEFDIDFDYFVRTTDASNCTAAQSAFSKMYQKGDIYKGEYEGFYCVSCETHFGKSQVIDNKCPDCGKEVSTIKEESYFFALSRYQEALLEWYEREPNVIQPAHKRNEVIKFVESGLHDLSITRTSFEWGVSVPKELNDPKHILYVWLDALISYISALGWGNETIDPTRAQGARTELGKKIASEPFASEFWENATHIVGKDILRFHAVYWPAFLLSLGLPLPKHIYAHGWWLCEGQKMSKSIGNVINPKEVAQSYGLEVLRYFLVREVPFGQDGDFSQKALVERVNSDLSNDIGNLLNRLLGMAEKYFALQVQSTQIASFYPKELESLNQKIAQYQNFMEQMQPHNALNELWQILSIGNVSISTYTPWNLMKENKEQEAHALLALIANILYKVSLCLYPVMPQTATKIAHSLGREISAQDFARVIKENGVIEIFNLEKIPPLFPRIENPSAQDSKVQDSKKQDSKDSKTLDSKNTQNLISIDTFKEVDLRVGLVVECARVEKSEKLLRFLIDLGEEKPRQILSGIAQYYEPQDLVGKSVCVVANLKPVKLMGLMSEGMILSAQDENGLNLLGVQGSKNAGAKIS